MNWTIYTGDNPPTDTSQYVNIMYDGDWDYVETIYPPGWQLLDEHVLTHLVRYRYLDIEPYNPEPERPKERT